MEIDLETFSRDWYNALTLAERIAMRRIAQQSINSQVSLQKAELMLKRWRKIVSFQSDSFFQERLMQERITKDQFLLIVGEPAASFASDFSTPPFWIKNPEQVYTRLDFTDSVDEIPLPKIMKNQDISGFLNLVRPLMLAGLERFTQEVDRLKLNGVEWPFGNANIKNLFFMNLSIRLLTLICRVLVLELNVMRVNGELSGDSSEERFSSFVEQLKKPEIGLGILREYPVLTRQVEICIDQWISFSRELLERLCTDWSVLQSEFGIREGDWPEEIEFGKGDYHNHGRSVVIIRFLSGLKVVYKPRSLMVDIHFQNLLGWLNQRSESQPFKLLKIVAREKYGWVEFVSGQECKSDEEVGHFYHRQGAYLALLYMLEASDFHYENIIAAGEHPVLIDLESLFHARLENSSPVWKTGSANGVMSYSVLRVGLLPMQLWANDGRESFDLSGLGYKPGQITPHRIGQWANVGTDQMCFTRKHMAMPGSQNLPSMGGKTIHVIDYMENIVSGFISMYHLILNHREELLAEDGILSQFGNDEVRVILRPTVRYARLLQESFHPDLLKDALKRDWLFDHLWNDALRSPFLMRTTTAEIQFMNQCDIPLFLTQPNSLDLWTSSGERQSGFFTLTGLELVQRRLSQMSLADMERQVWFIQASLATLTMATDQRKWPTYPRSVSTETASSQQLFKAAEKVGDRLANLALQNDDEASWLGVSLIDEKRWTLMPVGLDLYSGLPGIILFLAYLGATTHREDFTSLAQIATKAMLFHVKNGKGLITSIGGFSGWAGTVYVLTHLSSLWNRPDLIATANEIVQILPDLIENDSYLDIISGCAGCIAGLSVLHGLLPSAQIIEVSRLCGEHILNRAVTDELGVGWILEGKASRPLTGFSHGSAGMAWALLKLNALTPDERYQSIAKKTIEYERSVFQAEANNWPDFRDLPSLPEVQKAERPLCMTAWCHGAPGIGLARILSSPYLKDPMIDKEIEIAVQTTLIEGFGKNHSLCHGELGNLELVLQAGLYFKDPAYLRQTYEIAGAILQGIQKYGWLCGVPLGVETPGLMPGLAGIGYGLLRLACPERIPSILGLDPPIIS